MIAERLDDDEPTPLNYVETAEVMTRLGHPMSQQLARRIEQRALRKLAKKLAELDAAEGLEAS